MGIDLRTVAIIVQVGLILLYGTHRITAVTPRVPGTGWSGVDVDRAPGGELGLVGCGPA